MTAFEAYANVLRTVAEILPGMRVVPLNGAGAPTLVLSSFGLPSQNRALLPRLSAADAPGVIGVVSGEAQAAGVQVNWWLDPGAEPADLDELLVAHGYARQGSYPVMSLSLEEVPVDPPLEGVELGWVRDAREMYESQLMAGTAFGRAPSVVTAMAGALAHAAVVADPRIGVAVARIDGRMVGSGQLVLAGDVVGILNVATLEEVRGRGIGRAVTLALLDEAAQRGATLATLHASPLGFRVYQRMGFRHDGDVRVFRGDGRPD